MKLPTSVPEAFEERFGVAALVTVLCMVGFILGVLLAALARFQ